MRCLFVYPNNSSELRIPLALSILIACVRRAGHEVRLFDSTFLGSFTSDNEAMTKLGTHQATNLNELVGATKQVDIKEEFDSVLKSYKPNLICVSIVERNLPIAKKLLIDVDTPVLVGGIMPSIAPQSLLDEPWVDMVCIGEGEHAIVDLIEKTGMSNIWTSWHKNPLSPLIDMDSVPEQDWSLFDERHLLKPFMGKVYRGGAFEFSRGCFKSCTFCVAPKLREAQRGLGSYHRTKTPEVCIREIEHKISDYNLDMVAFSDTDFLTVPKPKMKEFLTLYKNRVGLPFTMQASVGTLMDEEILKMLRQAQCCAVSVGVESGSDRIQKKVIKKVIPAEMIKKAFELCRKHEVRVTANYMVGLPFETEEDVKKTIDLNKLVNPPSIAVTFFTPFVGTELYDVCIKNGFYKPTQENVYENPLDMPQLPREKIHRLVKEFTDDFKSYQRDFSIL